jgi:hypothetical protein
LLRRRRLRLRVVLNPSQPRRGRESYSLLRPFLESCRNVVRQKYNLRRSPNQFRFLRFRPRLHQRQHRRPIRWRHRHPSLPRLQLRVKRHAKPKLLRIKFQAPILVPHIHVDAVHAQMLVARFCPRTRRLQIHDAQSSSHRRDYRADGKFLSVSVPSSPHFSAHVPT